MGNSLGEDLTGRFVVLKEESMSPAYRGIEFRVAKVTGGFGAVPFTAGRALFVETPHDGDKFRMDGHDVERYATDEEIELVTKEKTS